MWEREIEGDVSIERIEAAEAREEEDEYDKVGVGKEGAGKRMYVEEITRSCIEICHLTPRHSRAIGTFPRVPMANHSAAAARLREDMERTQAALVVRRDCQVYIFSSTSQMSSRR